MSLVRTMAFSGIIASLCWACPASAETCSDFSGRWAIEIDREACQLYHGLGDDVAIQLPAPYGYMIPQLPAVIDIEQVGCESIRFLVVSNEATDDLLDFAGRETTFDLATNDQQRVSWGEDRVELRYRVHEAGGFSFPGTHRPWAEWSLEHDGADRLRYRYVLIKEGANLDLFPYREKTAESSCYFERRDDD